MPYYKGDLEGNAFQKIQYHRATVLNSIVTEMSAVRPVSLTLYVIKIPQKNGEGQGQRYK